MMHLRHAFRSLFKSPGFTLVAIATIAIGIAANTALFSAFNTLVLRPIALPDADKLVRIWTNNAQRNVVAPVMSVPKYRMFAERSKSFTSVAASTFGSAVLTRQGADPEQLASLLVTANFVPITGMAMAKGRNFNADEDVKNGPAVCILTYDIWRTRFGLSDNILGQSIDLDGVPTTVVGVLANPVPAPLAGTQILQPQPLSPSFLTDQQIEAGAGFLQVTARLKPGVSFAQASSEVTAIAKQYAADAPGRLDATSENQLRTWIQEAVGPVRPTFLLLLTGVGLVLLIACANVSNLFLSRLAGRHKEVAVRLSLGARRAHLVRQFLLETLVFCVLAATLGVLLAAWSLRGIEHVLFSQLAATVHFSLDRLTLGFTVGLSVLSSIVIGLVPALQASKVNLSDVLKDSSRGTTGGRATRLRSVLIVSEVALSAVLLVGSGLLLWSFAKLQATPPGFTSHGIASVFVNPPPGRYPTRAQQVNFYYEVVDRMKADPRVKSVAVTQSLPLNGGIRGVYAVAGKPVPPLSERAIAFMGIGSEDYFNLLHIPVKAGRSFEATDIDGAPLVCMINESFAKRLFPNENPVGQVLLRGANADVRMEIVGVVADVKSAGLNTPAPETMYMPLRQIGGAAGLTIAASAANGDATSLQPVMRAAVNAVDKSEAVSAFVTLDTQLEQSLGVQRITAWLTGAFAGVALLLSALGLYSVLAYAVSQRTGEIGIRMALGAGRTDVIQMILTQGMRLVMIGLVVGLGAAAAGTRLLRALLFNVTPLNPVVFAGVAGLFAVVAVFACLLPSWRASRVEALVALRSD